jgi:hypothetical protein
MKPKQEDKENNMNIINEENKYVKAKQKQPMLKSIRSMDVPKRVLGDSSTHLTSKNEEKPYF